MKLNTARIKTETVEKIITDCQNIHNDEIILKTFFFSKLLYARITFIMHNFGYIQEYIIKNYN